jgi:UDP-N-acetylmuramoyl-tripeptide--D-alanyl-D-alanine ligase
MNTPELYKIFLEHPNISIDSRTADPGSIFFALRGDNFNGNQYAEEALKKCAYAVVDDPKVVTSDKYILVGNVLEKMQRLAAYHRKRLGIPIIAITGTNGKTTTKELIAAVMSKKYKVAFTSGNHNNHIGVPLTLLQMNKEHEFGVVEMGANHIGEIEVLCKIASPDYGIITNVGKAHLEGFGSLEGVKKAKGELYKYLYENDGTAFINYDNEQLDEMNPPHSVIYYGTKEFTHCQGKIIPDGVFLKFRWISSDEASDDNGREDWDKRGNLISTKLVGEYNFENALAAVCIGNTFNVCIQHIQEAIENYEPKNNRSQLTKTVSNTVLIDSYNANPSSMKVAIANFGKLDFPNKIAILGEMLELGEASIREHGAIIGQIMELPFEDVFFVGPSFMQYKANDRFHFFSTTGDLIEYLQLNPIKNKQLLLKGSRGIQLEKVLTYL